MRNKILRLLSKSLIARNNYKLWYIQYLQDNYCKTEEEKKAIYRVLSQAPSWATYQREVARIQNQEKQI